MMKSETKDIPDPADAPAIRWGIIGVGWMADKFANGVNEYTRSTVVAVCSRSQERANAFRESHQVTRAYASVEECVADPEVDVIHVASPHSEHWEHARAAIAAGKHVLVEKAFTRSEAEAREVIDAARAAGVFVMEAMWTRFLPHIIDIRQIIARGDIGDIVAVEADHGQWFPYNPAGRLYNPDLAGGALLDLGVYPISFVHDLLGVPKTVTAVGRFTETGVDGQVSVIMGYDGPVLATLTTTLWAATPCTAVVSGTDGRIEIDGSFYTPTSYRVVRRNGTTSEFDAHRPNGYVYEAAEVARRVVAGEMESPLMTPDGTLEVMRTLDEVRRQIGLVYPGEREVA